MDSISTSYTRRQSSSIRLQEGGNKIDVASFKMEVPAPKSRQKMSAACKGLPIFMGSQTKNMICGLLWNSSTPLQGYLAHKKQITPLGPPQGLRHSLTVGSLGGAVSYERGTPVQW